MSKGKRSPHSLASGRLSRRKLLRSAGISASLAPFVPLLGAEAQASTPKRVVFCWSPNGCVNTDVWKPTGTERAFQLSEQMTPFEPWKDQLTIINGLGFTRAFNSTAQRRAHAGNPSMILSGRPNRLPSGRNNPVVDGMTLDQYLAQRLSSDTPFPILNFSAYRHPTPAYYTMSYNANGERILPEDNAVAAFNRVFGNGVPSSDPSAETTFDDQRSVLDGLSGELTSLQRRIGAHDRHKLEGHLEAVRSIEQALARRASIMCDSPPAPDAQDWERPAAIPATSRVFIDMIVEAFKCDLTRVATMQWTLWRVVLTWLGHSGTHHDSSHGSVRQMTEAIQWCYGEIAYLMERLAEVPEGAGTMLDNTLIVWFSEFGQGRNHQAFDLPWLLAGGGAHLPQGTGRFIQLSRHHGHADLLTSICQVMGLDDEMFGDPRFAEGALSELV